MLKLDRTKAPTCMLAVWLGFVLVVQSGCGNKPSFQDAETALAKHFSAMSTNGIDVAMTGYGDEFFSKTTRDEWRLTLQKLNTKLGAFKSFRVTDWRFETRIGTGSDGTIVKVRCETAYSKFQATETFVLLGAEGAKEFKIIGHHVSSDGFLKD